MPGPLTAPSLKFDSSASRICLPASHICLPFGSDIVGIHYVFSKNAKHNVSENGISNLKQFLLFRSMLFRKLLHDVIKAHNCQP